MEQVGCSSAENRVSSISVEETAWGELPPVEGTTQVTRSMLEMLNAKPYVGETSTYSIDIVEPEMHQREVPTCPYVSHSIALLAYIAEIENLIQEATLSKIRNIVIPKIPEFKRPENMLKKEDESDDENKRYGASLETVQALARKGVATLALHYEYEKSTNSALEFLADLTMQRIATMSKSLRLIMDNEALTGRTGFYDATDQLLHDYDIDGIAELDQFFKLGVIKYHDNLVQHSKALVKKLEGMCNESRPSQAVQQQQIIKQEEPTQSGWVTVQNTSGQSVSTVLAGNQQYQPFVKTESHSQLRSNWTPSPAQNEVVRGQELSSYMNTFRPISPSQDPSCGPRKKKPRK